MNILKLFAVVALLALVNAAGAHAQLQRTSPAEGSVIQTPPTHLVLSFSEPTRLTVLSLQKKNTPPQALKPLPTAAAKEISVALPPLTPGAYAASWHGVGADGHVISGLLHFSLAAAGAADGPARH